MPYRRSIPTSERPTFPPTLATAWTAFFIRIFEAGGSMAGRRSRLKTALAILAIVLAAYGIVAYIVLPLAWTHYEHQKGLAGRPMVTRTAQDIPGDPINV